MGSIFEDLSVLQIKQKTLNTIEHAFRKRYGDDPDDELLYRYHEEVSDLLQMDRLIDVAFLYDLVAELTDKYIPYYGAGAAGSSLVLNMLGITKCNPLPAHLYCPKCKELIWLKDDNTTIDGICPVCGTEMVSDGYNIPSESFTVDEGFYTVGDVHPMIVIDEDFRDGFMDWWRDHWIRKIPDGQWEFAFKNEPYICSHDLTEIRRIGIKFRALPKHSTRSAFGTAKGQRLTENEIHELGLLRGRCLHSIDGLFTMKSYATAHPCFVTPEEGYEAVIAHGEDYRQLAHIVLYHLSQWDTCLHYQLDDGDDNDEKWIPEGLRELGLGWIKDFVQDVTYLPHKAELIEELLYRRRA